LQQNNIKLEKNMRIGIIIAMDKEFIRIASLLDHSIREDFDGMKYVIGKLPDGKELVMQHCGMGKVNSSIGTTLLISRYHPDLIISSGVAGGASLSLNVKDVVVSTKVAYHDAYYGSQNAFGQVQGFPLFYESPRKLIESAESITSEVKVKSGLIVTGDWFVDSKTKMREILEHFPDALAVDMESASIAQICHIYHVPFVSFRIISDIALADNNATMYENFWDDVADGSFEITHKFINSIPSSLS
jgi:adenosylhomocysteine nucleosidase